jgi:hypothetical protein
MDKLIVSAIKEINSGNERVTFTRILTNVSNISAGSWDLPTVKSIVKELQDSKVVGANFEIIENNDDSINIVIAKFKAETRAMLEGFEKRVSELINKTNSGVSNLTAAIDKISKEQTILKKENKELREENKEIVKSLEHYQSTNDNDIKMIRENTNLLKEKIKFLIDKQRVLEDRSRRNNIRVFGICEGQNETWEETELQLTKLLNEKLNIKNVTIERAHRTGKASNKFPRAIVAKLLNFKDKENILQNAKKLKDTGIFIKEDFSYETQQIRKSLWEEVKGIRESGKYAVIKYDKVYWREFTKR